MIHSKNISIIVIICLVAVGFVIGIVVESSFLTDWLRYDRYDKNSFVDTDAYQAVFLTNDQIYFGRLKNIDSDYLILSDVYYVKVNENGAGQMVKLGAIEPHGPKDEMTINKEQVLFWENMRFDSQVVKTIQSMQSKEK